MNQINLIGRLSADPEIKVSKNNNTIAHFSIAVSENREKVNFFKCTAFNAVAEVVEKYTKKGKQVAVTGRLSIDEYTTTEGEKKSIPVILIERIELLGKKDE